MFLEVLYRTKKEGYALVQNINKRLVHQIAEANYHSNDRHALQHAVHIL